MLARELDVRDRGGQMAFAAGSPSGPRAPIGAVVNNAGVTVSQPAATAAPEDDEWVFDVNFWGVVHGTRAFLPILLEQDSGAIVNISSVFGLIGWPTQSAYCASKFAVRGYTESLRHELRETRRRRARRAPRRHRDQHRAPLAVSRRRPRPHRQGRARARVRPGGADLAGARRREIQRGVERGKDRILIGADAGILSLLARSSPVRYFNVIKRLEPIIRR